MTDDVGVGVALKTTVVRNRDATEDERAFLNETMGINRRTNAELSQWAPPDDRVP